MSRFGAVELNSTLHRKDLSVPLSRMKSFTDLSEQVQYTLSWQSVCPVISSARVLDDISAFSRRVWSGGDAGSYVEQKSCLLDHPASPLFHCLWAIHPKPPTPFLTQDTIPRRESSLPLSAKASSLRRNPSPVRGLHLPMYRKRINLHHGSTCPFEIWLKDIILSLSFGTRIPTRFPRVSYVSRQI